MRPIPPGRPAGAAVPAVLWQLCLRSGAAKTLQNWPNLLNSEFIHILHKNAPLYTIFFVLFRLDEWAVWQL